MQKEHDAFEGVAAHFQKREGPETHTCGVGRDEVSRRAYADVETGGDVDEYAHHDEFGNAEGKSAERQGKQSFIHRVGMIQSFLRCKVT